MEPMRFILNCDSCKASLAESQNKNKEMGLSIVDPG